MENEFSKLDIKREDIIEVIKEAFNENEDFIKTDILKMSVFKILESIFLQDKKIIFLDAPTGTGKSIIGYMIHFCFNKLINKHSDESLQTTYTLTSSKILQDQIENDINRFKLENDFSMLKGQSNYKCLKGTEETKSDVYYPNRVCKGVKTEDLVTWPCYDSCEYIQKRLNAASSPSAVINYSYFLTVLNLSKFNKYFAKRRLVIADEGHLVPQIITNMFQTNLTTYKLDKICKLYNNLLFNFQSLSGLNQFNEIEKLIEQCYYFFNNKEITIQHIIDYYKDYFEILKMFKIIINQENKTKYFQSASSFDLASKMIKEEIVDMNIDDDSLIIPYLLDLKERPIDLFIQTEFVGKRLINLGKNNITINYNKFVVRDLSEAEMVKKYFINNGDIFIFMSATIGNIKEFATLLGLKENEYLGLTIPSTFDFSKSPIYICNSGWLNFNNFEKNINKVIDDTLKIVDSHSNDKGIIHTSTFNIANKIHQKVLNHKNRERFLFYETPEQKEEAINKLVNDKDNIPYVIIGPSLYEGLDLKNDLGRFNIIVKAPYSGIDDYTKKKMNRYPFWYERETLEKLQQAIGRTNRNKTDWSIVYLMDSMLEKLIWKLPNYITARIKHKKI